MRYHFDAPPVKTLNELLVALTPGLGVKAAATDTLLALVAFKVEPEDAKVKLAMAAPVPAVAEKVTTDPGGYEPAAGRVRLTTVPAVPGLPPAKLQNTQRVAVEVIVTVLTTACVQANRSIRPCSTGCTRGPGWAGWTGSTSRSR